MKMVERLSMLVIVLSLIGVIYAVYQMSQIK